MQQMLWQPEELVIKELIKPMHSVQNAGQQQREETKDQLGGQPIFRIDTNIFNLKYQLDDPAYRTHANLLTHTKIRPQDREKLKSWLLSQTQNLYERETYAYASKYLDIFFTKGHKVQKNAFQALGIACLVLASKFNERRVPNIQFQVFDRTQIFEFQRTLLKIFNFRLNPVTYVSLAELLFYFWDNYQYQRHPFKNVKYFKVQIPTLRKIRIVMETLECLDLVHQTLNFPLNTIVLCVFFLQNRRFCIQNLKVENMISHQTDADHQFHNIYQKFMNDFINSLTSIVPAFGSAKLYKKILLYTMYFSRINPKIKVTKKFKNFRYETVKQTYNPQISQIAQKFLNRKPNSS